MIEELKKHIATTPFVPFAIRMADGREYKVPTRDHIWLPAGTRAVFVVDDDGIGMQLPGMLISGLVRPTKQVESN